MSWTLGIDTSSTTLGLGLLCDGEPNLSFSRFVKNSHSEHITTGIQTLLSLADISVDDISRCAVVTGPGSFTGLRIGVSFAKGLLITKDTKVAGISTLEHMAFMAPVGEKTINVAIDARQDYLFFGQYKKIAGKLTTVTEDRKITKDEFLSSISTDQFTLYDTAGNSRSTLFDSLTPQNSIALSNLTLSSGLSVALCAEQKDDSTIWNSVSDIFPNYMQESYAERMKK